MVRDYVVPFETVPRVKFTEEESIKLGTYAQDIVNYATENVVKFITGEKSLSEWDAYVAELNNIGNFYQSLLGLAPMYVTAENAFLTQEMICALYEHGRRHFVRKVR